MAPVEHHDGGEGKGRGSAANEDPGSAGKDGDVTGRGATKGKKQDAELLEEEEEEEEVSHSEESDSGRKSEVQSQTMITMIDMERLIEQACRSAERTTRSDLRHIYHAVWDSKYHLMRDCPAIRSEPPWNPPEVLVLEKSACALCVARGPTARPQPQEEPPQAGLEKEEMAPEQVSEEGSRCSGWQARAKEALEALQHMGWGCDEEHSAVSGGGKEI